MPDVDAQIRAIIDRETLAWDTKDVDLLLSVLHEDMVWPWPPNSSAHDPMQWVMEWGRYDRERWRRGWQELFDTHQLIHNRRTIQRIVASAESDGAFAVVDVDTLWKREDGVSSHWLGRACKLYTLTARGWKMIAQTGLLDYSMIEPAATLTTR
jgi:ketosteroid isomerase-like protein